MCLFTRYRHFFQISLYESSIFDADELLVMIQDEIREADFYLASIVGVCPNLKSYEEADHGGRATIYYLE